MPAAKKSSIPAAKLALYEKLIAAIPEIERKGAVHPYTSLNGHMFSYLDQTGTMGLRLPKDEVDAFLKKYKASLFESYGVVKKDYVTVPDSLLRKTEELKRYLKISYEYVKRLKPK
jgi:hypothetical protein